MSVTTTAKRVVRAAGIRRSRAAAVRMCCERTVLSRVGAATGTRSRILCYHSVGTPQWGINDVGPERFRRQIELALGAGYRFVPAGDIAQGAAEQAEIAITFDDGLTSVATNAAPILREYGIPYTVFVVSDWAEGRHAFEPGLLMDWAAIERLAHDGAVIGSHSVTHPNFGRLDATAAAHEVFDSREEIRKHLGLDVSEFAIPFGQSGNWTDAAAAAARDAGYTTVYAQSEERRPASTAPRTFITRFDSDRVFRAALAGRFDRWEEWL